jgi:hypothetical protein
MPFKTTNDGDALSSKRLLCDDNITETDHDDPSSGFANGYYKFKRNLGSWALLHLILISCYAAVFIAVVLHSRRDSGAVESLELPRTYFPKYQTSFLAEERAVPAREALKPEIRRFPTVLENNPFVGKPRSELEEAWHYLLQSMSHHTTLCYKSVI